MVFKNIGLFGKFNDSSVTGSVDLVKSLLQAKGLSVLLGDTTSKTVKGERLDYFKTPIKELIDLAIILGGDGTMLNVARSLAEHDIPAVGVNLGRLGFLTDIAYSDFSSGLSRILQGDYEIEPRTMLQCQVSKKDKILFQGLSLNDVALSKGNTGRLIEFKINVNNQFVSQPRSDGIILSTPTGSTAYALSSGGPIIYPNLPVISMSLICPHTLSNRPIILDEKDSVEITELHLSEAHANLSLDGLISYQLVGDEKIQISGAQTKFKLIRMKGFNYFETLHNKLGWKG